MDTNVIMENLEQKLISIIMPTWNGAQRVSASIQSVLSQSYRNWELLIIDDGSIDTTKEVVSNFISTDSRIYYLKNENNIGIQKSLNKGLKEAKGEYIARIDDDDVWIDSHKLQKQFDFLCTNSEYVLVGTGAVLVDEKAVTLGKYLLPKTDSAIRSRILRKNCFTHSTVMYQKDITLSLGGYSELVETLHVEDYDLWLKLGLKGRVANIPEYMVQITVSDATITSSNRIIQAKRILSLIKKYKKSYPHFFVSYVVCFVRYLFFSVTHIIPVPKKILYYLQSIQRGF